METAYVPVNGFVYREDGPAAAAVMVFSFSRSSSPSPGLAPAHISLATSLLLHSVPEYTLVTSPIYLLFEETLGAARGATISQPVFVL